MTCQPPDAIGLSDDCCFSCFELGRLPYLTPIAIVLHESDGHIEEINNKIEDCCDNEPGCHKSFHYGVGQRGEIYNWVDPENTSWSFDQFDENGTCWTCGWSIATQQGNQDPNLYTINIVISTGFIASPDGRHRSLNTFSTEQYNALVRLVGWLAETYNITINQNNIWRHCDELGDFPDGCPGAPSFSDFLSDVNDCINSDDPEMFLCVPFCDAPVEVGPPRFLFGAQEDCDNCGKYEINLCDIASDLPAGVFDEFILFGLNDDNECISMSVDPTCNTTEVIDSALGFNSNGIPGLYQIRERLTHRDAAAIDTLIPATDRIIRLDASDDNVIFDLAEPDLCGPQDFWVKRTDCNQDNTVAINGVVGDIDNEQTVFLNTPGPKGSKGESIHIYWHGSGWEII